MDCTQCAFFVEGNSEGFCTHPLFNTPRHLVNPEEWCPLKDECRILVSQKCVKCSGMGKLNGLEGFHSVLCSACGGKGRIQKWVNISDLKGVFNETGCFDKNF